MKQNGNVIFIILVAVALFASLTYAVMQSGSSSSGGGADKETMSLKVTELISQANAISTLAGRLCSMKYVDQLHMNADAYNESDTTYPPGGGTSTGSTMGIFSTERGIPNAYPPIEIFDPGSETSWRLKYQISMSYNSFGSHIGTTANDEVLWLPGISHEACQEINRSVHGTTSIPNYASGGPCNRFYNQATRWGTYNSGSGECSRYDVGYKPPVCVGPGPGSYWFVHIVRAN